MEGILVLLGLVVPLGLLVGWALGIAAWRRTAALRAEVTALRAALRDAGIAVPEPAAPPGAAAAWPPPPHRRPAATPPEAPPAEAARVPAAEQPSPAAAGPAATGPNPWAAPPPPPPPLPAAAAPAPQAAAPSRPGLEEALAQRWGVWLGAAALLLAGVFLIRTAAEEGWLGPGARCALAALLGLALVVAAERLRRRPGAAPERPSIPWPDQAPPALAAGGVAVLFGAAYGAAVLYALVPPLVGFALLALAAMAGIALALLQGPLVAAVGIAGAYLTPLLVETRDPSVPGLFAYLLAVTAAALLVLRQVGAAWLGWAATAAAAAWALLGGTALATGGELWVAALFLPAVAALQLRLLPAAGAPETAAGRRLAWIPFAALALVALALVPAADDPLPPAVALLLLTPVAAWTGARERRLDRLPWVAAGAGLLGLLAWPLAPWVPAGGGGEAVTVDGVVQGLLPGLDAAWAAPEALRPFLLVALALAALHAAAGLWQERRAPRPLRWAALTAAVPVLALLVAYARVKGFAPDARWALAAAALALGLTGLAGLAARAGRLKRAGAHAAGAVAALALGCAMVLSAQWLTLAVALFLPPLAWIEGRTRLRPLRRVALAVAAVVLARLLLNPQVPGYAFGALPVLNGLLLAYGAPALCFALAAAMFHRRGGRGDATAAVLEAGSIAFLTALVLLEARHAVAGGSLTTYADGDRFWSFQEGAVQATGLTAAATLLRWLSRRLGERRPVLRAGWKVQMGLGLAIGAALLAANPALHAGSTVAAVPVLNELLLAFALPALLAAAAAAAPESRAPPWFREALAGFAFAALLAWVTLEVRRSFHPAAMALDRAPPAGAELYAYSFAWLAFGAVLLALGVRRGSRALRLAALGVIALTVGKAFLVDMAALTGLWRVLSFLGLGLALIALGGVYRRFVVAGAAATPPAPAPRA